MKVFLIWTVAILAVAAVPACTDNARTTVCETPEECASEATATAVARHDLDLSLDSLAIDDLAIILEALNHQHATGQLSPQALEVESRRWGAAYGEMFRTHLRSCWGPPTDAASSRPFVLHPECRDDWEWDVIGMVEELIITPQSPPSGDGLDLTIRQKLFLSSEVLWE